MLIKKLLLIIIILVCFATSSLATTYYVKTGGNDSAAGISDDTAWAHCPGMAAWSGAAILAPGDTIKFRSQDSWNASDSFLMISTAGTTGSRIIYDGSSYGTGTKATFLVTGRSSLYAVVQIRVSNITFTGFKVDTNKFPLSGIAVGFSSPSPAGDIENITVSECEVTMGQTEDGWVVTSPYDGLKYISRCSSSDGCTATPRPGDGVNWSYYWDLYEGDRSADSTWSVSGTYFGREWYYSIHPSARGGITSRNILIEDNYVHDVGHEGIPAYPQWGSYINSIDGIVIRGNRVINTGQALTTLKSQTTGEYTRTDAVERKTCIDLVNDVDNAIIEFNYCENGSALVIGAYNYDCPGECNQYADNYTIRYNILKNTIFAINAAGNDNMTGYGSFYGNLLMEGYVSWGGNDFNSKSHKIYNNTIYVTTSHGVYHTGACYNQENVEFKNNIIYQNGASAGYFNIKDQSDCMVPSQKSNNLYYRKTGTTAVDGGASDYTIAQIAAGLYDTNAKTIDPFFTGGDLPTGFSGTYGTDLVPNTAYFSLQAGSPALTTGETLGAPYNSAINWAGTNLGRTRPSGAYDIGAYQEGFNTDSTGAVLKFGTGAKVRPGGAKVILR